MSLEHDEQISKLTQSYEEKLSMIESEYDDKIACLTRECAISLQNKDK